MNYDAQKNRLYMDKIGMRCKNFNIFLKILIMVKFWEKIEDSMMNIEKILNSKPT